MASLEERLAQLRGEQEGGSDATQTGGAPATDSPVTLEQRLAQLRGSTSKVLDLDPNEPLPDMSEDLPDLTEHNPADDDIMLATTEQRQAIADQLGIDIDDIPTGPARMSRQINEYGRGVRLSYNSAKLGMEKGRIGSKMKRGTATDSDLKRLEEIDRQTSLLAKEVKDSPYVAKSFGTLAPFLLESGIKGGQGGLVGGMVGGSLAFLLGQLGPQAALPEELLTVPAGTLAFMKIGAMFNSVSNIADIEGGSAFLEMKEMGMDPKKAAVASDFVGLGSGLLEMAQFKLLKRLLPGSDKMATSVVAQAITKVMKNSRLAKGPAKLASATIPEAGVETLQEFWKNVVEVVATDIQSELDKTDLSPQSAKEYKEALTKNLWDTFAMTATGFAVAAFPGVAVDVAMGGNKNTTVKGDDGVTFVAPDRKTEPDVRTVAPGDSRPTVNNLMGVADVTPDEADITENDGSTVLSDTLDMTSEMVKEQLQTNVAIDSVLEEVKLKKGMQSDKIDIVNNQNKMDTLEGLYVDAVSTGNHEEALELAEQYRATVDDSVAKLQRFTDLKNRRLSKDNAAIDPSTLTDVNIYIDEQTRKAGDMVNGQVQAIRGQEAQAFMDFSTKLNEDPKALKSALMTAETTSENLNQPAAKIYRKVANDIDAQRWMTDKEFFGRKIKIDKLLETKGDLERKILKEKEDVKVSGTDKAIDDATINWIDATLAAKVEFDEAEARAERIRADAPAASKHLLTDNKTPFEQRQEAIRKQAEEVKVKQEEAARAKRQEQEAVRAQENTELAKRRAAVQEQEARVRKPAPKSAPRTAELKEAREDKAKRDRAIAKQKEFVRKIDEKAPAKPLKVDEMKVSPAQKTKARELFRSAGISIKGKVFEGSTHSDAVLRNKQLEDFLNNPKSNLNDLVEGFVQKDGTFVNRKQASKMIGAENVQSEQIIDSMKSIHKLGHKGTLVDAKAETLAKVGEAYKAALKDKRYKWVHTLAKAMGVKSNIIFSKEGLKTNPDFQKMHPDTQTQMLKGWDGLLGAADPNTFVNFVNAETMSLAPTHQLAQTMAHEVLHGIVRKKLSMLPTRAKELLEDDLRNLWNSIPQELKDKVKDETTSSGRKVLGTGIKQIDNTIQELITYSMTSPEFASWLNTIPSLDSKGVRTKQTIWEKLVNLIAELVRPTKLTDVVNILNTHLDIKTTEAKFSREDTSFDFGANVSPEAVKQWTNELDEAAVNALETVVVKDKAEAAEVLGYDPGDTAVSFWVEATETTKPFGANKGWSPQVVPGRVVLIADRIQSQEHAISKWMHEQVGHQGLKNIFPTKATYQEFMMKSYNLFASQDSAVLNEIVELYDIGKVHPDGSRTLTLTEKINAAEEVIGNRAGTLKAESQKGLVARMKAFLSRWLPKVFVGKQNKFKLTDKDVWNIISMARENVFTGNTQFGDLIQKALNRRAPKHKFQKWSTLPNFQESDETYKKWMREVRKTSPKMVKWYTQHKNTLLKIFGKDADLFNILLSVTSPNADVETNVIFAAQTYAYLRGATDRPGARFVGKLKKRIDEEWTSPEAMFRNLESNLFKVTEFNRALSGDPDATVGDMWMYRAFFGDPLVHGKTDETFSIPQTIAMRQKLHDLASQMSDETGETWTPREAQAAIWVHINAAQTGKKIGTIATYESGLNKPSPKFGGRTPREWLNDMFDDMADGPLSDKLGIGEVPMAPISPLEKKLLGQIDKELKAKKSQPGYKVDNGNIVVTPSENKRLVTVRMMRAIADGGHTTTVTDDITADWLRQTFGFQEGESNGDGTVTMSLRPEAIELYKNDAGKVVFNKIRDNLGGFSGTYTQEVRFSREAVKNLEQIKDMSTVDIDAEFIRTGNDGQSVLGKVHEWRDQSELNWNRFTNQLEQEYLDTFGGRKSRVKVLGSGRTLNTQSSELLQKAMNLYIDSGIGKNLEKVKAYTRKLLKKWEAGKITNRERQQLDILERMENMSTEEKAWADNTIRPYYENLLKFAQENKLIDSQVDNYVKRSWKMPKELEGADVRWSGGGTTGFTLTLDSGKQRTFDSIVDGWENGMDLKTEGVIAGLQTYGTEMGYTFSNRRFVNYMRGLIDFSANGLMFEVNPKTDPDFKQPAGYVRVVDRGFAKPGHILYARKDIGTEINKMGATASWKIWNIPVVKVIRKMNAIIKSTILSVSLFHHLAGMRSYTFGVGGKGFKINPIKAYKRGLAKIDEQPGFDSPNYKHLGPVVDLLVREGLTLGKTQDWDEAAIQDSIVEEILANRTGKLSFKALKAWQGARRFRRGMTTGLFNRLFAGLKAEAASLELGHKMKTKEKKLGRALTDAEIKTEAQKIARLINADFGGLHLKRMGRNPDLQRLSQMLLLAPDWTESNWRTVTGMIPGLNKRIDKATGGTPFDHSMAGTYGKFWAGIAIRGAITVALANAAILTLFGDEDDWEDYGDMLDEQMSWKNFSKGRWASVPVGPVYRKLGMEDPEKRPLLSVMGHFKDILKLGDVRSLVKHKISPAARIGETLWSGTDWKHARFTSLGELIESGGKLVVDNKFEKDLSPAASSWATLPSLMLYNVRQSIPIYGSEFLQAANGESNALSALLRAGGLDIRDTRRVPVAQQKFEEINSEVNQLNTNLKNAQLMKDQKMIFEARRDIRNYKGFNRIKSRLGFTKSQIAVVNRKLKPLELKVKEGKALSTGEQKQIQQLRDRKQAIYQQSLKVLKR
jgi:hypothetical protein